MDEEKGQAVVEKDPLLEEYEPKRVNFRLWLSIIANIISTVAIIFVNKRILSSGPFRHALVTFAAFHFSVTGTLLWILSRPSINLFQPKALDLRIIPLALSMIANVVLQNAALARCSIQFNQVVRVLLTPTCALLNFALYRTTMSLRAALTLIPICVGVGIVTYVDTDHSAKADANSTTPTGVVLALTAVCASAIYTLWIKSYHKKLDCNSWQLLLNQSAMSVGIMIFVIPFSDNVKDLATSAAPTWMLVGLSGVLASIINLSLFIIVDEADAISSTVVGHFKTCSIVVLGYMTSNRTVKDTSLIGFAMAIGGIMSYSYITFQRPQR